VTLDLPLVTVVVPAFHHEQYVEQALQSVYEQDYEPIELVVIDDRSPDRTAGVIRDYLNRPDVKARFRRTIFFENEKNAGAHQTINRGIRESRGRFINVLNSDDLFARRRLSRLVTTCLERRGEFAFSKVDLILGSGNFPAAEIDYFDAVQESIELFPTVGYAFLRSQCALSTGNFFFSRAVYERVGGFRNLKYCHDWDFALRCLLVTEPIFVPEPLYSYRLHPTNSFRRLQSVADQESEAVLRNYFFLCRNRPVANPLAPSPAWDPFFSSFVQEAHYTQYLAKP
jgi:glycosyltransferase involved in cell wall biosynthesis